MSKQFWAILIIIVLVLVGVFALTGKKPTTTSNGPGGLTQHVEGQGKAGVTLVEYGDYECPFCGQYYQTLKQVEQQYDQQIHFQFRNFPLTSVHPNAFAAARAAEAAALQDKTALDAAKKKNDTQAIQAASLQPRFWQMHDILYANQDPNGQSGWVSSSDPLNKYFVSFAQQIGLDVTQFKQDFSSDTVNTTINADLAEANKLGLNATPTFFIDGKQVQINNTVADFQKILNAEITKKGGTPPTGTTSSSASTSTESTAQTKQ